MQPRLATPRLSLRPVGDADIDRLWRLLTDPETRRYLCDDRELPRAAVEAMAAEARGLAPRGLGLWGAWIGEGWAGAVGLLPVSGASLAAAPDLAGEVEPVVALEPWARGRGLAAEAVGALVGHALVTLGLPGLVALVDEPNEASHRLLSRAGFEPDGEADGPRHPLRRYRLKAR